MQVTRLLSSRRVRLCGGGARWSRITIAFFNCFPHRFVLFIFSLAVLFLSVLI
jgi:hypothetical protein